MSSMCMSVMLWTYAAIGLLAVLTILLVAPYFGVYGTTDPFDESPQAEGPSQSPEASQTGKQP